MNYKQFYEDLIITNYFWFRNNKFLTEEILLEFNIPN